MEQVTHEPDLGDAGGHGLTRHRRLGPTGGTKSDLRESI
jgi:hypothetical protein